MPAADIEEIPLNDEVVNETKKIMHLESDVQISCTEARVPVFVSHSEAVDVEFEKPVDKKSVTEVLKNAYGVEVVDDVDNYVYPVPTEAAGKDPVYVGRIRKCLAFENGISFFCVADNLRIGAALNTVRLAKLVIEQELY